MQPRQSERDHRRALDAALSDMRKMGAASATYRCPVCGVETVSPLNRVLDVVFGPCLVCGAPYRDKSRVANARMN